MKMKQYMDYKHSLTPSKHSLPLGGKLFVDTSWFKAFSDPKDDFYKSAIGQYKTIKENNIKLITTNYILDESYTLIRKRVGYQSVMDFNEMLPSLVGTLKLVRITPHDEFEAWTWFKKDWSDLSFTDCTSFAVMKRLELKDVATFDNHFARAGFTIFK